MKRKSKKNPNYLLLHHYRKQTLFMPGVQGLNYLHLKHTEIMSVIDTKESDGIDDPMEKIV